MHLAINQKGFLFSLCAEAQTLRSGTQCAFPWLLANLLFPRFTLVLSALTIARDERPVESAVRVQLAPLGWSFAGRSLHEELVLVEGALLSAIQ